MLMRALASANFRNVAVEKSHKNIYTFNDTHIRGFIRVVSTLHVPTLHGRNDLPISRLRVFDACTFVSRHQMVVSLLRSFFVLVNQVNAYDGIGIDDAGRICEYIGFECANYNIDKNNKLKV